MTERDFGHDRLAWRGDELYAALMRVHDGLDFAESAALNARLVLILANLVDDPAAVIDAVDQARPTGR